MSTARILPVTLPLIDPAAALAALPPGPGRVLLEFGSAGPDDERHYALAAAEPFITLVVRGREAYIFEEGTTRVREGDPYVLLQSLLNKCRVQAPDGFPGPPGGAIGYFGREPGQLHATPADDPALPDLVVGFYDLIVMIDYAEGKSRLLAGAPDRRANDALDRGRRWYKALRAAALPPPPVDSDSPGTGWDLYRRLRTAEPAPFAAFMEMGFWQVVATAPERSVTGQGGLRRDNFTGGIGCIGFDGRFDLNPAVRTAIVKEGQAHYSADGGPGPTGG